jgi:hypothetical protein
MDEMGEPEQPEQPEIMKTGRHKPKAQHFFTLLASSSGASSPGYCISYLTSLLSVGVIILA